jgi:ribosomal protein S18 acetylase RimI-like enzyme
MTLTPEVIWRPVTPDDVDFMIELFLALRRQQEPGTELDLDAITEGTRAATLEQAQGRLADSTTYVIELVGTPIGRLRVVRTDSLLEIAGLQIHPEHQNGGAGTTVVSTLVHEARDRQVPALLEVGKDNPDARRLYLRLGFTDVSETDVVHRMTAA